MDRYRPIGVLPVLVAVAFAGCAAGTARRAVGANATTTKSPAPVASAPAPAPAPAETAAVAGAARYPTGVQPATTATPTTTQPPVPKAGSIKPVATTPVPATSTCLTTLAGQMAATGGGSQLITVVASSTAATSATVTLWHRSGACWTQAAGPWTGRLGYHGSSTQHREGDGTTPIGLYAISPAFYGIAPDPGVKGSYHQLVCGDWWDEDPASAQYNTFQHLACDATPAFGGKSEALWKTAGYQHFAVVGYNTGPVVPGAGSAIFVHVDVGSSTNGCVSLPADDLKILLRWLEPGQSPHIAIGTSGTIRQL